MACPPERYANLPIAPQYKESLIAFCSDPNNAAACEQLCAATDEEIVATVEQIAPQLEQWQKEGIPEEIRNASPELAQELAQGPNVQEGLTEQGIGALPQAVNPSIPPGQLANVPMPMDVPSGGPPPPTASNSYRDGGFVNAPSYGIGGLFKGVSSIFGGKGGTLGAIIGGALAIYTGGMSLMAGAALGSAAGTFAETKDLGAAAGAGARTYGLGIAGANVASGTAAGAAKGAVQGAKILAGPPEQPQQKPALMPAPEGKLVDRHPVSTPGEKQLRIGDIPQINQGLGSLPSMAQPFVAQPSSVVEPTSPAIQQNPMSTLGQPAELTPMDAYYQCVAENGAANCQLPTEMLQQGNPVNIQPAQYAQTFVDGGSVDGIGTETSDSQPAWLSDNEFVMTADAVRGMGNGDINAGANRMYQLMAELETRGQSHGN